MRRVYPKEKEQKLKDTIKDLRSKLRNLRKENKILRDELKNIIKPVRTRKIHEPNKKLTEKEWIDSFKKRVDESIKGRDKK